jgi:hypothetical protein
MTYQHEHGKFIQPKVLAITAPILAFLQYGFCRALEQGELGPTPDIAVFGPALIWVALDFGLIAYIYIYRTAKVPWWIFTLIASLACAAGTYFAFACVDSYLEVV